MNSTKYPPAEDRKRKLAAIHAAAAALGMDTADKDPGSVYRTMLRAQGGVSSAADLSADGRRRVLAYLLQQSSGGQAGLIKRLWAELGAAGKLRNPTARGLDEFILKTQGVASASWLTTAKANQVIEALKAWKVRAA